MFAWIACSTVLSATVFLDELSRIVHTPTNRRNREALRSALHS